MKKIKLTFTLLFLTVCVYSQNIEYVPWGIWDYGQVDENSPIINIYSGSYHYSRFSDDWIVISQNPDGIVSTDYTLPVFGQDGIFARLEVIEKTENGFILHLAGDGIKLGEGRPKFKDDIKITLKMIFISENECKFQYDSETDTDGFRLGFGPKENRIYRRYRAIVDDSKNDSNKKKEIYWVYQPTSYKETHIVIDDNVNLYKNADINSEIIMKMNKNFRIQVIEITYVLNSEEPVITQDGKTAPLVWIKTSNGTTGWCFSGQLERINSQ